MRPLESKDSGSHVVTVDACLRMLTDGSVETASHRLGLSYKSRLLMGIGYSAAQGNWEGQLVLVLARTI